MKIPEFNIIGLFSGLKKEQKQLLILGVVGTIALLFAYFNLLLIPQVKGLVKTASSRNRLSDELKKSESDVSRIGKLRSDIDSYSEKISRYGQLLPAEEGIPTLLESLADMARSSSMKIVSIVPLSGREPGIQPGQAYRAIPIMINARAGFHELGRFMATLESSGRLMKIADIRLKENRSSPKKHDVEILVMTYVLLTNK